MPELTNELLETIRAIKALAPDVWALMVKGQIIEGWVALSILVPAIALPIIAWRIYLRIDWSKDLDAPFIFFAVSAVVVFMVVLTAALIVPEAIAQILVPEYYALKELLP